MSSTQRNTAVNTSEQAVLNVNHILEGAPGLKALLCDEETRNMLSICYSQRQLLQYEVVFVDLLSRMDREFMSYLRCVVLCRPSRESLDDLYHELQQANFNNYHIYFTGMVSSDVVQSLANADQQDKVERVEEVFMDVTPVGDNLNVIPLRPTVFTAGSNIMVNPVLFDQWDNSSFARLVDGLCSTMLLIKRRPVIRYRADCKVAERIATDLSSRMRLINTTFPDIKGQDCVLLICDRLDDPCTPLLSQWTYEAMIHELIGIVDGNKVVLEETTPQQTTSGTPDVNNVPTAGATAPPNNDDNEAVAVLSSQYDSFFDQYRYSDWGTVVQGVQKLVNEYKENNTLDRNTASLEDIKNFMQRFPEAKKRSLLTARHTTIASRLNDEIRARNLFRLSELEQQLFEYDSVSLHSNAVLELVQSPDTEIEDALRLAILYNLRYEGSSSNNVEKLKNELLHRGCSPAKLSLIDTFAHVAGAKHRLHQLFNKNKTTGILRGVIPGFGNEIDNIYTMHTPLMKRIINRLYNGQLNDKQYPVVSTGGYTAAQAVTMRARDIIIVMPGGVSLEEARLVHQINQGEVNNVVESVRMNFGALGKLMAGGGGASREVLREEESAETPYNQAGSSTSVSHPVTPKIESRVVLATTAVVNSSQFLKSFLQH